MAYILASRLVTRRLLGFQTRTPYFGIGSRAAKKRPGALVGHTPCVQQITERPDETHDDKNYRLGRPLAPHLSVYKPQLTSVLSILHRISGTVGGVYLMIFSGCALFLPYDLCQVCDYIECMELPQPVIWFGRFVLAFPYVYHTCNGVRHLAWDTGNFFTMSAITQTGMAMLAMCCLLTIVVVFLI